MNRIRTATVAALLASFIGLQPAATFAQGRQRHPDADDRSDRREDQRERREEQREHRGERREESRERRDRDTKWERREEQRERQEAQWNQARREEARREAYGDAARYYRSDNRAYRPRRLTRNDRIYRGSDNRYYCQRDDGTTGLIIGGIGGGVLGNIIAPGGWKTLGTIIGAGGGALLGRAIDDGDVVCR